MSGDLVISVILCTRDRADVLGETLRALSRVHVPSGWQVELLVVDNGSVDNTHEVVHSAPLNNIETRYLHEPAGGQTTARNAGLAKAKGDIIVFIDDDVIPAQDWLEKLLSPLLTDSCDAVTGGIRLAPELVRQWMTPAHRWWLGSSGDAELHNGVRELIGANMAFKRSVLDRVRGFDLELGPGALGFADDTLFGWQLSEAGFKIGFVPEAKVVHHLDADRLLRKSWLAAARARGKTEAYLQYHWEHTDIAYPRLRWLHYWLKLQLRRMIQRPAGLDEEGCAPWEISYVLHIARCEQYLLERRRPRNYARRGLRKRRIPEKNIPELSMTGQRRPAETVTSS